MEGGNCAPLCAAHGGCDLLRKGLIFPGPLPSRPGPRPNGNSTAMFPNLLTHGSGIRWLGPGLLHMVRQVVFSTGWLPSQGAKKGRI